MLTNSGSSTISPEVKLERLPQLLNDPDFVKSIEGTEYNKRNGYTWFWTDTVGTNLSGYYRINPQGKTLDEMFTHISDIFDSKVQAVPFNEIVHFYKGNQPLSVVVWRSDVGDRRLDVDGDDRLGDVAPAVVVEQVQVLSKPGSVAQVPVITPEIHRLAAAAEQELETFRPDAGLHNTSKLIKAVQEAYRDQ